MVSPLDLSLLDHFVPPGVFTRIDPNVESSLAPLPEVRERVAGCVSFCHSMGEDIRDRHAPTLAELAGRRKYLRAALSELSSMEDAAQVDFAKLGRGKPPLMRESLDGRLHVVRLLRHANVHLSATTLSHSHRDAIWNGPNGPQEFEYLLILGNDLGTIIPEARDSRHYDAGDLTAIIAWLDAEQHEWGLNHVILRVAELYARSIVSAA